jgi:quinol monooxygenase YgiN
MKRIVQLTFKEDKIDEFFAFIEPFRASIASSEGCISLTILQSREHPNIVFTYSHWQSASDLEKYRNSPLFEKVWSQVKQWFSAKPMAWSLDEV